MIGKIRKRGLRRLPVLAAGAAVLVAGAAMAQSGSTPAANKPETVVVTAPRTQQDVDTIVSQFVDLHAATNRKTGQYMRDDIGPVCPVTLGLPQAFDDFISRRVVQVAASVGAKTDATGKCTPNIEILFTDEPQAVVKLLADRTRGAILGMHYMHETPRLLDVTHPIQGWYVTATRMLDVSDAPLVSVEQDGTTQSAQDIKPRIDSAYHNAPDRVATGTRLPGRRISSILNVLIVADIRQVGGREVGSIADYITMLALSEPRSLDQCNDLPSILDLMSSECESRAKPDKLTDSDIAYLKALYAADLGATTNSMQKASIQAGMEGQMGGTDTARKEGPESSK
ncbi:MAG TPA: hypothetical protein VMF67_07470 [Rhizomicrobium sp.]|nr:hypothetical protein [Rhizomicrobium sp.]